HALGVDVLGDQRLYLKENEEYQILFFEGQPISIELPASVILKIVESEPGVKGDSVSNLTKTAKLETGAEIKVPLFVEEGNHVKVDTRTGEYIERARV
ncbi:MAG: elongation factor P, partial [candidate division Zixibacteria bacterium]|nr:elongation factor P [candidate division Zixibacteria bacterium]